MYLFIPKYITHIFYYPSDSVFLIFNMSLVFSRAGDRWIYPVIDWSKPGPTIGIVALVALILVVLHLITVGLAAARDRIAFRLLHTSDNAKTEQVPLRQNQA